MAYGLLAGVDPVVGIYTAFFPVLIYIFLGTMPHVSMGSFAVISIMVFKPVSRLGSDIDDPTEEQNLAHIYSTIQVATAISKFDTLSIVQYIVSKRIAKVTDFLSFCPFGISIFPFLTFVRSAQEAIGRKGVLCPHTRNLPNLMLIALRSRNSSETMVEASTECSTTLRFQCFSR